MPKLTRDSLSAAVAGRLAVPQAQAEASVEALLVCLAEAFRAGQAVELRGFGTFKPRESKARFMRHPKTGQEIAVGPTRRVLFRYTGGF